MAQNAQDQALLREALKRTQATFDAARSSVRFEPPDGTYNVILKAVDPLEAKPSTKNPNNLVISQYLELEMMDPPYQGQTFRQRISVTEGMKFGGNEWKQAAFLLDNQEHNTIPECADILSAAAGKVRFSIRISSRSKGANKYTDVSFLSATPL